MLKGFEKFSDGPAKFKKHEKSEAHKRVQEAYMTRKMATPSVSVQIDSERAKQVILDIR